MSNQRKTRNQRALVVGISKYPRPITKLPGVAADVSAMAALLGGNHGVFSKRAIKVLTEKQANRQSILDNLKAVFDGASSDDTIFVYVAGHGDVENGDYFFIAYDTAIDRITETAIPLKKLKSLFDRTKSRQVCIWLDFCHSGGILAQRRVGTTDDWSVIKRTLHVVQGQGKVIYAACNPSQSAYEDSTIGHGLFTHALLRGLRGQAVANGEVTVSSLYDFIDREVGSHRQRPEFFGHLQGRIVLMHYGSRAKPHPAQKPKQRKESTPTTTWVLLDRFFVPADLVRTNSDRTITIRVTPQDGEQEASVARLCPSGHGGGQSIAFAYHNDAAQVRVQQAESEAAGPRRTWTLTLRPDTESFGGSGSESALSENGRNYSADDVAALRARRILLDEVPPSTGRQGYGSYSLLESFITGSMGRFLVKDCPIRSVYAAHGKDQDWKDFARLLAIYYLKASGTVEHIIELKLGAVRAGKVAVAFRGRRRQYYSNVEPTVIEIKGHCPLGN